MGRIERVIAVLMMKIGDTMDPAKNLTNVLKAIANPIRLKILALCLSKERTSKELGKYLNSQNLY